MSVNTFSRVALGAGGATLALGSATCSVLAYQQNFASEGLVVSGLVLGIAAAQEVVKIGLNLHVARNKSGWVQKAALAGLIAFSTFGTGEYLVTAYQHGQVRAQQLRKEIAAAIVTEDDAQAKIAAIENRVNAIPDDWVTAKRSLMACEGPLEEQLAAARVLETGDRKELVLAEGTNGLTAEAKAMGVSTDSLAYSLVGMLCVFFEPLAALSIQAAAAPAPVSVKAPRKSRKSVARKAAPRKPAKAKKPAKKAKRTSLKKQTPARNVTPYRTDKWNHALSQIALLA